MTCAGQSTLSDTSGCDLERRDATSDAIGCDRMRSGASGCEVRMRSHPGCEWPVGMRGGCDRIHRAALRCIQFRRISKVLFLFFDPDLWVCFLCYTFVGLFVCAKQKGDDGLAARLNLKKACCNEGQELAMRACFDEGPLPLQQNHLLLIAAAWPSTRSVVRAKRSLQLKYQLSFDLPTAAVS